MRRVALASAESNAAPSVAKPIAARPAGERPKNMQVSYVAAIAWAAIQAVVQAA
jgi:hypothetical protein